jgi:hypothetical protein
MLKSLYLPVRLDSEAGLVAEFLNTYRRHDPVAFDALLARESGAEYRFTAPGRGTGGSDAEWDAAEESRLQRRMFNPDLRGPGETQVTWYMRLHSQELFLHAQGGWTERPELYRSDTNPSGLDPARWRATGNTFTVNAWFKNIILHVYSITGEVDFVVLEDRALSPGAVGEYLLYRWVDRTQVSNPAGDPADTTTLSWTAFKRLYD